MPNFLRLAILTLLLVGCRENNRAFVSGTISVNGEPAATGSISFFPLDGKSPTHGGEIVAGKYDSEAPLGESKVEIRIPRKTGSKKLYDTPDSPVQDTYEEVLPPEFNSATKLRFTAQPGKSTKDWEFDLKK